MTRTDPVKPLNERVSIVIPSWNGLDFITLCLDSIFEMTDWPDFEVIVVDNASTDGTLDYLRSRDDITLITNDENLGFGRACNIGYASAAEGSDIVLLNNDVRITDAGWITAMRSLAYDRRDIAIVGCRQVNQEGQIGHAGSFMPPLRLRGDNYGEGEDDIGQYRRNRRVEAVIGAVMYLRRDHLDAIGLFDEEYFAYYEDTDLCFKAEKAGLEVWYCGEVTLEHAHNVSRRENDWDFWSVVDESGEIFRRKWGAWIRDRHDVAATWNSTLHEPIGYAQFSREAMLALYDSGVDVTYRGIYQTDPEPPTGHLLIDDMTRLEPRSDAISIAAGQADLWHKVGGKTRVGFTMLEVDGLPADWVQAANKMDEVWVPSDFNQGTFAESGVTRPIHVIPLGVDLDHFNPEIKAYQEFDDFVFLSVFTWGERKAPELLLRAFNEEFTRDDGVSLLIVCTQRDPVVDVIADINNLHLRKGRAPVILSFNAMLEGYQMGGLYRSTDAFVMPTRGEGWGMPILEAMACGLPTIATNWSGQTAFYDEEVGFPIRVDTLEPAVAICPFYTGFRWALPDLDHLREQMRHVVDHPAEAKAKGSAAADRAAEFTWTASAEKMKRRLLALS